MKFKKLRIKTSTRICLTAIVLWVAAIMIGSWINWDGIGNCQDNPFDRSDGLIAVGVIAITLLKFILGGVIDKKPNRKSK
jgi:hypothetical protein